MIWLLGVLLACGAALSPAPAPEPVAVEAPAPLPEGWLERVVGAEDHGQPLPMVVMVHGLGDRPESMLRVMGQLPGPARVIAPRAPDAFHDGWSWFPIRADGDENQLAEHLGQVADRFADDLASAQQARPTVGKPVMSGFSQGGMLSFAVAVRHPDAVALAVPVAGWLPEPLWPEGGPPAGAPPIHALHGLADDRLPFERTSKGVDAMRTRGWEVTMQAFPEVGHRIPPQVQRALYREVQQALPVAP